MKTRSGSIAALLAFTLSGAAALQAQAPSSPSLTPPASIGPAPNAPVPNTPVPSAFGDGSAASVPQDSTPQSSIKLDAVDADPAKVPPASSTEPYVTPRSTGSQVRIVRLSQVKGEAQVDRNTARGFEAAIANLPIIQGAKLRTREGVAEVEFEDNSTLRLTPNTEIEFPRLGRDPSGGTTSNVNVVKGIVYVSLAGTKGNQFNVLFGKDKLILAPSTHIQLYVGNPTTRLGVYEGSVQVEDATGTTIVPKKKALLFDAANQSRPTLVSNLEKTPYDGWDKNAVEYHKRFANASAFGSATPGYGVSDMNYYGSFVNMPGCGAMWRPYFTSAAWDPFANGTWAWYQGAGYSWVSPYPWGWTPYHSGEWQYCSTGGWGWRPGNTWTGLANSTIVSNPRLGVTTGPSQGPTRPKLPLPPRFGSSTLISVNTKPLPSSNPGSSQSLVIRNDSAGIGVPRDPTGKLGKVSAQVMQHGSVSMGVSPQEGRVSSQPSSGAPSSSRPASASSPGVSHPSSMPASTMGSSGMGHGNSTGSSPAGGSHR